MPICSGSVKEDDCRASGATASRIWRFELHYIREITRNSFEQYFKNSVNAIDLRAGHYF